MAEVIFGGVEIISGEDLLKTSLVLQEAVAETPQDDRDTAVLLAQDLIGPEPTHYGSRKVELHANLAYLLPDERTADSEILPIVEFRDARFKGILGPLIYVELSPAGTLAWTLLTSTHRGDANPNSDTLDDLVATLAYARNGTEIRRPLFVPVGTIESVLVAA